ncbi:membrane protein [Brevibacillus panacihumi W25]|uniref:Membrane protein n=1 Tax=Brevibacillus panacihumi W25 TaxID=1408254 RepID=V6MMH6_9BACL|nr:membrane protein [Brevibacillus panacihumi W25]
MFDEFFYRRRKNKGMLILMIIFAILGVGMLAMGILFLR